MKKMRLELIFISHGIIIKYIGSYSSFFFGGGGVMGILKLVYIDHFLQIFKGHVQGG